MATSFGTASLDLLLKVSVQVALVAVLVWVITRLGSKAPAAWRNALWLLVLVKFLVPPFAYYPAGLAFWQNHGRQVVVAAAPRTGGQRNCPGLGSSNGIAGPAGMPEARVVARLEADPMAGVVSRPPKPTDIAVLPLRERRMPSATSILVTAWLTGVGVMLAMVAIRFSRQARLVRGSSPAGQELTDMLRDSATALGVRRLPGLRVSSEARTPMLVGCISPTILLPQGITERCGASDLKAMLLHELAHVRRRDMLVMWLQQLAQTLFYFHPALWLAGREIKRERELACDELVLSKSAIAAKDYAAGYVSALKLANGVPSCSASLAMAEPFDMEKRRLNMILTSAVPKLSARWVAALALVAAVGLPTFAGLAPGTSGNAAELAARVLATRAHALATIRSGKGGITYSQLVVSRFGSKPWKPTLLYSVAFSGERFALSEATTSGADSHQYMVAYDGRTVTTMDNGAGKVLDASSGAGRSIAQGYRERFDIVQHAYPDPSDYMFKHRDRLRIVGQETLDGSTCVIVECVQDIAAMYGGRVAFVERLWVDPSRSNIVPRAQLWSDAKSETVGGRLILRRNTSGKSVLVKQTDVQFRLYGGIWGPARCTREFYTGEPKTGKRYLFERQVWTYGREFALNVPVSDSDLKLPLSPAIAPPAAEPSSTGFTAADMLAHVTEARTKALAVVKSGKGSLVYSEGNNAKEQTVFASVAFLGEKFVILLNQPPLPNSRIACDGHAVWRTEGYPARTTNGRAKRSGPFSISSYRRLFDVVGQAHPDLAKVLLYHKGEPRIVGYEVVNGSECVVVESVQAFPQKNGKTHLDTRRLWIDAARGYAVPKLQVWSEGREFKQKAILSETNIQLCQYDGVWGPARYTHSEYRADLKTGKRYLFWREAVTYGRDFALNVPVSDSDLKLPLDAANTAPAAITVPAYNEKPHSNLARPEAKKATAPSSPRRTAKPATQSAALTLPCQGKVTTQFGYRIHPITHIYKLHTGIDIDAPTGTPVRAAADGQVLLSGWQGAYGNAVIIDHGGRVSTLYGHCSKVVVPVGAKVHRGEIIAYSGSTGYATGPKVHFEKRVDGKPVNPTFTVPTRS